MDQPEPQSFLEKAEDRLAGIRGSLLLFARGRLSIGDLSHAQLRLDEIEIEASAKELAEAASLAAECSRSIEVLAFADLTNKDSCVNRVLDLVSRLEAELLQMPLGSEDFLVDVDEMVEFSFELLKGKSRVNPIPEFVHLPDTTEEDFEVDDETLEIFRSEAEALLANITASLEFLAVSPDDQNALWEIRRNAHTFKGAAGIIGFHEASRLAHRIEDILDKMVESRCGADGRLLELLSISTTRLNEMTVGEHAYEAVDIAEALSSDFDKLIASIPAAGRAKNLSKINSPTGAGNGKKSDPGQSHIEAVTSTPTPIVRVSLERLDELLKVSHSLLVNRSALAERFAEIKNDAFFEPDAESLRQLESLIETQRRLSDEMQQKLLRIRMVRFGTLEMRLNRAVHVTCQEENKKAIVVIENADLEIDTQVIDALIEPLLHLLKNAVVHGIESPETRRLLGKPEKGTICIAVNADEKEVYLSVEDDGRGISGAKLVEKALANGVIDLEKASAMDENSIYDLIFQRGLTTADSLNLNAGRGIGMSIVKESVESRGGRVIVESEQQKGTKFTVRMPVALPNPDVQYPEPVLSDPIDSPVEATPLVLIVDDSQSIRRMTAKIVEDAGCRAITAVDGADALELLLSNAWEPDLILSDVEMPNMDGWDFLEYIKTDTNFGHIPVVLVTSLDSDECRQKGLDLGAAAYLVKPFRLVELDRVLENIGKLTVV